MSVHAVRVCFHFHFHRLPWAGICRYTFGARGKFLLFLLPASQRTKSLLFHSNQHFHFFSGTILKRWKKNWFDLWSDGHLIYYDDQTRQSVEDKVHMPVDCINIRMGHECRGRWFAVSSFCHLPVPTLGGSDSSFLAILLSFTDQRRVSCRQR